MNRILLSLSICIAAAFCEAATVQQVAVRQMWPWNTKVEISFLLDGTPGEDCDVRLEVFDADRPLHIYSSSLDGELANINPGEHRVV